MPKMILLDEFQVSVHVPRGLSARKCKTIRQALDRLIASAEAVRETFRHFPILSVVQVKVSR